MSAFVVEHDLGMVFRSGDPADLARVVTEVLSDPARWTSRDKRATLVHEWSWQAQEVPLGKAYRNVRPTSATPDTRPVPKVRVVWA
jgi:hypothetical protein